MADSDLTCKYVYKKCYNTRTTKKNGNLHSLCEYHRAKANMIQKAYATKKRSLSKAMKCSDAPIPYSPLANENFEVSESEWLDIIDALGSDDACSDIDSPFIKEEFLAV
ncbi:hypothetical protein THRCLA_21852 [Thraustotheca clavata]|uniref:Uncharacterized protein n=1 Tax=Thraustotheca clavata TaxID=74557 RepID=A0A1V9ZMF9_9STRA|nr:hypothetical protein THRCLA_21852 [Thraustotheca clavata]